MARRLYNEYPSCCGSFLNDVPYLDDHEWAPPSLSRVPQPDETLEPLDLSVRCPFSDTDPAEGSDVPHVLRRDRDLCSECQNVIWWTAFPLPEKWFYPWWWDLESHPNEDAKLYYSSLAPHAGRIPRGVEFYDFEEKHQDAVDFLQSHTVAAVVRGILTSVLHACRKGDCPEKLYALITSDVDSRNYATLIRVLGLVDLPPSLKTAVQLKAKQYPTFECDCMKNFDMDGYVEAKMAEFYALPCSTIWLTEFVRRVNEALRIAMPSEY